MLATRVTRLPDSAFKRSGELLLRPQAHVRVAFQVDQLHELDSVACEGVTRRGVARVMEIQAVFVALGKSQCGPHDPVSPVRPWTRCKRAPGANQPLYDVVDTMYIFSDETPLPRREEARADGSMYLQHARVSKDMHGYDGFNAACRRVPQDQSQRRCRARGTCGARGSFLRVFR
jgi:hypothetical protein